MPRDTASFMVARRVVKRLAVPAISDAYSAGSDLPPLPEHSMVRALVEIHDAGYIVPKGAIGAVVGVMLDGQIYDVEFTEPAVVVSASRSELAPCDPI